jgi:hypothetical protein
VHQSASRGHEQRGDRVDGLREVQARGEGHRGVGEERQALGCGRRLLEGLSPLERLGEGIRQRLHEARLGVLVELATRREGQAEQAQAVLADDQRHDVEHPVAVVHLSQDGEPLGHLREVAQQERLPAVERDRTRQVRTQRDLDEALRPRGSRAVHVHRAQDLTVHHEDHRSQGAEGLGRVPGDDCGDLLLRLSAHEVAVDALQQGQPVGRDPQRGQRGDLVGQDADERPDPRHLDAGRPRPQLVHQGPHVPAPEGPVQRRGLQRQQSRSPRVPIGFGERRQVPLPGVCCRRRQRQDKIGFLVTSRRGLDRLPLDRRPSTGEVVGDRLDERLAGDERVRSTAGALEGQLADDVVDVPLRLEQQVRRHRSQPHGERRLGRLLIGPRCEQRLDVEDPVPRPSTVPPSSAQTTFPGPSGTGRTPQALLRDATSDSPRPVIASVLCTGMTGMCRPVSCTSTRTHCSVQDARTAIGPPPCNCAFVTSSVITNSASATTSGGVGTGAERTNERARAAASGSVFNPSSPGGIPPPEHLQRQPPRSVWRMPARRGQSVS